MVGDGAHMSDEIEYRYIRGTGWVAGYRQPEPIIISNLEYRDGETIMITLANGQTYTTTNGVNTLTWTFTLA